MVPALPEARVVMVGRVGCHLCDEARAVIARVVAETGDSFAEVDIDVDPQLARYTEEVPVTFVDGLTRVLAIELLTATRGIQMRAPLTPGPVGAAVIEALDGAGRPGPDRKTDRRPSRLLRRSGQLRPLPAGQRDQQHDARCHAGPGAGHAGTPARARGAVNGMVSRPRHGLSLCAGGGGLDLGLMLAEPGYHTRAFVEWEDWPRSVLIAAQRNGYFAPAPIWAFFVSTKVPILPWAPNCVPGRR